ncbi:Spo7-like protein-domain-containing protein [Xylaria bambusicola]|uniref:Spo7-like protein-domain-containing protein n=1 Tax=Xylaria bambusicola TaxID=326684 RepID=UPI0020086563|nr:Spo7-like protein-domain-containing protein [Xylaria bambusicola]KAI0502761.1 Spo7-like protein-domain-containing protein [Xylaria bambusicola]
MADSIDSIVKGAPQPGHEIKSPVGTSGVDAVKPVDPLHNAPSSPSMIYLNMLILEASLRAQYLELRARRRKHTFFLSLLCVWLAGFGYALFLAPREDGSGVGGSVYWVVDMTEKVCFISGIVTGILVWATGIWDRGIRWPRRWFTISNRGLRGFNCKLVVIKRPWWVEIMSTITWFFTYGAFSNTAGQYRFVEPSVLREVDRELNLGGKEHPQLPFISGGDEERGGHEEDLAPGGDYVKLLLWPKPFSANFRENWEIYRNEYWEKENERRALLRKKLQARDKQNARQRSRWFWWFPGSRRRTEEKTIGTTGAGTDFEKNHYRRTSAIIKESKRTRSGSVRRGSTSAGSSSRSPTPPVESDEASISRKASTGSNASDKRRKKHVSTGSRSKRPGIDGQSVTPENPSPLARGSSVDSDAFHAVGEK